MVPAAATCSPLVVNLNWVPAGAYAFSCLFNGQVDSSGSLFVTGTNFTASPCFHTHAAGPSTMSITIANVRGTTLTSNQVDWPVL